MTFFKNKRRLNSEERAIRDGSGAIMWDDIVTTGYSNLFSQEEDILDNEVIRTNQSSEQRNAENNTNGGLFILNESGKRVNNNAKKFFKLVNDRCGNIFKHNPKTGAIYLAPGKSSQEVISSSSVSKIFAKLIEDNISQSKQPILFRVGKRVKGKGADGKTKRVVLDGFPNGKVDIEDIQRIGADISIQTTLIYHFFYERILVPDYEKVKSTVTPSEFDKNYHTPALIAELNVLTEMGRTPTYPKRIELIDNKEESLGYNEYTYDWGNGIVIRFKAHTNSKISDVKYTAFD